MRYALLALLLLGCTTRHVTPAATPVQRRAEIVARDIAWRDTTPLLRFNKPYVYGAIRLQVEECSGLTRDGWPEFYVAPLNPMPGNILAFYDERIKAVVFALGNETSAPTISHEILHFLLAPIVSPFRQRGETHDDWNTRVHPAEYYGPEGKCASLLSNPGR